MANLRAVLHPVGNGLALIVAVAAVTIWSARLEHRMAGLEAAIGALAAVPATGPEKPALSPQQACANLAMRIADALQKPGGNAAALQQLLHEAGCPATAAPGK